jgi:hypothetical protein
MDGGSMNLRELNYFAAAIWDDFSWDKSLIGFILPMAPKKDTFVIALFSASPSRPLILEMLLFPWPTFNHLPAKWKLIFGI